MSRPSPDAGPLTLLTFVKDDWRALTLLLARLDSALAGAGLVARLIVMDDGSQAGPETVTDLAPSDGFRAIERVEALVLARNLGHQRAIAVGLSHLAAEGAEGLVVVLDGDGEDRPEDVPRLVAAAKEDPDRRLVFASRSRRAEGVAFRVGYRCYQVLHWLATGRGIRVGNFSAVPASRLGALACNPDLWNHYAASVFAARMPTRLVPCPRGERLEGRSRLNLVALVVHGLSAIACYRESVVVRLAALFAIVLATALGTLAVLGVTALASPASGRALAAVAAALVALTAVQVLGACALAALLLLSQRSAATVFPLRDHAAFIDRRVVLRG